MGYFPQEPSLIPPTVNIDRPNFAEQFIDRLLGHISTLARQKFSSNVVQKSLRKASPRQRQAIMNELLDPTEFPRLVRDQFANYVIQTAVSFGFH